MTEKKPFEFVHVELVRDHWLLPKIQVSSPEDAIKAMQNLFGNLDREILAVLHLSTKNHVINASICSMGTIDSSLASPDSVYRTALLSGASHILLVHNHPSGDPHPSTEDLKATRRIAMAGQLMNITLLDHVIFGGLNRKCSVRESMPEVLSPDFLERSMTGVGYSVAEKQVIPQPYAKLAANRRQIVDQLLQLMKEGYSFYDPQWNRDAMAPRNPISHIQYRGANRIILMTTAMHKKYKDPRWMTFHQISEKGYRVRKGEHAVPLEKWIFSRKVKVLDADGIPVRDQKGNYVYKDVPLEQPTHSPFLVFNAEQVEDFPSYETARIRPGE